MTYFHNLLYQCLTFTIYYTDANDLLSQLTIPTNYFHNLLYRCERLTFTISYTDTDDLLSQFTINYTDANNLLSTTYYTNDLLLQLTIYQRLTLTISYRRKRPPALKTMVLPSSSSSSSSLEEKLRKSCLQGARQEAQAAPHTQGRRLARRDGVGRCAHSVRRRQDGTGARLQGRWVAHGPAVGAHRLGPQRLRRAAATRSLPSHLARDAQARGSACIDGARSEHLYTWGGSMCDGGIGGANNVPTRLNWDFPKGYE